MGDYKLWGSFEFRLRSESDLLAHGFEDFALRSSTNAPSTRANFSVSSESRKDGIKTCIDAAQADGEGEEEEDEQPAEPVVKLDKAAAGRESKNVVTAEEPEQTITSILGQFAQNAKKGKASSGKKSKSDPKSKPETKDPETREEAVPTVKAQLLLPPSNSARAGQAYRRICVTCCCAQRKSPERTKIN